MSARDPVGLAAVACAAAMCASGCESAAPPGLGPEVVLAAGYGGDPTAAVDENGAYYVAWVGSRAGEWDVYLARSEDGARFSEPVRVNDLPGDAAPHAQAPAQVATGRDGHVYVLWQNNTLAEGRRFPYSDLRLARSLDGGRSFEPAVTVNDDAAGPPTSHTFHDLAVAANGTVFVSWIDSRVRALAEAEARAGSDTASAADAGHDMGAMHDASLPGPQIRVAWSTDGGRSFGESVVVGADACPCCRTSLAIGPNGEIFVAWRAVEDGSVRDIVVARSNDGGRSFSTPIPVHRDGWRIEGCPHAGASLAVDSEGALHVAWYTGAEGRAGVYHARSANAGMSFEQPTPVMTGDWVPISQVRLNAAADGIWIAWEDRRAEVPRVRLARIEGDEVAAQHPDSAAIGITPALAGTGHSRAVAWQQDGTVRFRPGTRSR